jgi:hypothetical protein
LPLDARQEFTVQSGAEFIDFRSINFASDYSRVHSVPPQTSRARDGWQKAPSEVRLE